MKTGVILSILFILIAAAGGGYFYYTQWHQPKEYARAIIPLYDRVGLSASSSGTEQLKNSLDYSGGAELLRNEKAKLKDVRSQISLVVPPKKFTNFHQDFIKSIDLAIRATEEAELRADFFANILVLKNELSKIKESIEEQQKNIRLVRDLRNSWLPHFSETKAIARKAFSEKVLERKSTDKTIEEIRSRWDETEKGIDFITSILNSMKADLPVERISSVLKPEQNQKAEEGMRNVEKFLEFIGPKLTENSAYKIIDLQSYSDASQVELSEMSYRIYLEIEDLKRKYLEN